MSVANASIATNVAKPLRTTSKASGRVQSQATVAPKPTVIAITTHEDEDHYECFEDFAETAVVSTEKPADKQSASAGEGSQ